MLPPSLACLTCNPCTTSALFEYFGCGLTPYAARKKSKVDINVPFAFFPFCAWLTGKQKNSAPPTRSRKTLPFMNDAPSGTRTLDPLIKSQLLYQLS